LAWITEYTHTAKEQLRKLGRQVAKRILNYMDNRVASLDDPRSLGKALSGTLGKLWRYRTGDYRVICDIQDTALRVLVIRAGSRDDVYKA